EKMVFMYTVNSLIHGWWEKVTLIIWGAPAKLVSEDVKIQEKVKEALDAGVHITACKACADQLGVTEKLENMNIEVKYWGVPLTELLTKEETLLTI
ncbi:MAG: DsrE family protein, partial [Thermodesulfobacteriota bacterium]|nr:DsrE family protein [Thermodesulfobacteriota bacterium]